MKSSKSRTPEPSPNGTNELHILNPNAHGIDNTIMNMQQIIDALFLGQFVKSLTHASIFSKTASTVENAAKVINKKNNEPQTLPKGIF